jgi:Xaa-Pro aminopeptidase
MLTKDGCLARRKRLWEKVSPDVEWLLIADPRHVQYLANFWVRPISFSGGERGLLLLERNGRATLLADNFTIRSAAHEPYIDAEIVEKWYDHKHSVVNRDHALTAAVKSIARSLSGRRGAVESEWLPVDAQDALAARHDVHADIESTGKGSNGHEAVDLGTLLRSLRRQKEPDEIELLRHCMRATDAGHARAREVIREGVSEFEMFCAVHAAAQEAAGLPILIYGDFRGANGQKTKVGGLPIDYRLQAGDLFILDYSVVIDGYRSDFTNTLAVGAPSDEQVMLFELCQASMRSGENKLAAGVPAREVYEAVSKPMRESGYGPLGHHAGHGIGLAHPEPPILVPESDDVLVAGDVVTLEPGMYIEGIGGMRIENNYLITATGMETLSNHVISLT